MQKVKGDDKWHIHRWHGSTWMSSISAFAPRTVHLTLIYVVARYSKTTLATSWNNKQQFANGTLGLLNSALPLMDSATGNAITRTNRCMASSTTHRRKNPFGLFPNHERDTFQAWRLVPGKDVPSLPTSDLRHCTSTAGVQCSMWQNAIRRPWSSLTPMSTSIGAHWWHTCL